MRFAPSRLILLIFLAVVSAHGAFAEPQKHVGLSLIRAPKHTAGFTHFDYVNPNAPKGGVARMRSAATFDNLNPAVFRGALAPGLGLLGASLVQETLMTPSLDEAETSYCLLCEWVSYPDDFSSVTFKLRDTARWHDGKPVSPEDVIFSMETLKARDPKTGAPNHPQTALYYRDVLRAEKTGEREVTFHFATKNNRELPVITGQLTVFPHHWWTANGPDGHPRDITRATLEPPLGSGPYRVKTVRPGDFIAFERVPDYWGADLPVRRGTGNFDVIQLQYYGDQSVTLEAFKAGQYDFIRESSAKAWATAYNFPAIAEGKVVKREVELAGNKPMQGFAFNLRRAKFQDRRVRQAFNLAFNFEWANQNLFFGQYRRTSSFFQGGELAASGLPSREELALLEPLRDKVPPEVFTAEYKNPEIKTPSDFRTHLRQAAALLKAAGWDIKEGRLQNAAGEPIEVEFLIDNELFERIILPYVENLSRLGIRASIRRVDSAEYTRRLDNYDFDIVTTGFAQSESPGNEQLDYWGSAAAAHPGSRNVMGIQNPAIDALIEKIIYAPNRDALVAATRALDRVLLWNYYLVPQWYAPGERIAYWNKFGMPNPLPARTDGFPDVWWYDAALAAKNGLR